MDKERITMDRKDFLKAVSDYEKNQLMHHGVKGQQWGVKHGPPYPINGEGITKIAAGTTMHRVTSNPNEGERKGYSYVTYDTEDAKKYSGKFTFGRNWMSKDVYDYTLKTNKELTGPSKSERFQTFQDLYKKSKFKEAMKKAAESYDKPFVEDPQNEEDIRTNYKLFTRALGSPEPFIRESYFKVLKSKGYNMVQDDLDTGLKMGKYPTIVFDNSALDVVSKERVDMFKAAKNWLKYGGKVKKNEIKHYGTKGQKWGVRHWQNADGTFNEAGKERYFGKSSRSESSEKDYKENEKGSLLVAMAAGAAVSLLSSLGIKVGKDIRADYRKSKYEKERASAKEDPKTGLLLKSNKDMSIEDDIKRVNPAFENINNDGSTSNCQFCSAAYDLRRRGYEVYAGKRAVGADDKWFTEMYKPKPDNHIYIASPERRGTKCQKAVENMILNDITKGQEGARGEISVCWDIFSGHSFQWEVKGGKVIFVDSQSSSSNVRNYLTECEGPVNIKRLDNVEPDIELMKKRGVIR